MLVLFYAGQYYLSNIKIFKLLLLRVYL